MSWRHILGLQGDQFHIIHLIHNIHVLTSASMELVRQGDATGP